MIRLLSAVITGPLERHARGFADYLLGLQYSSLSVRNVLYVFAHLSRWLEAHHLRSRQLTPKRIAAFLTSRRRAGYTAKCSPRALDRMLEYLRSLKAVPPEPQWTPHSVAEQLLVRYGNYLQQERGLARSTIRARIHTAVGFLITRRTHAAIRTLTIVDVHNFLRRMGRNNGPSALAGISSDLRCLLRFLFLEGFTIRDLRPAVPSSVGWRNRTLPRGIGASDLRRILTSCDRRKFVGKRDFAILLLLSRLGLRQGEVAALSLDDFDWVRGEIVVRGKQKSARLPLPDDVGRALTVYLRNRPHTTMRQVFLRVRAPFKPLDNVQAIVFSASRRAGVGPIFPHRLRHTAATEMLRRGASLGDIAQVLRHSSIYTTTIYAKVDRRALQAVVQRWPGARS